VLQQCFLAYDFTLVAHQIFQDAKLFPCQFQATVAQLCNSP
jgi:hypothetical protein